MKIFNDNETTFNARHLLNRADAEDKIFSVEKMCIYHKKEVRRRKGVRIKYKNIL